MKLNRRVWQAGAAAMAAAAVLAAGTAWAENFGRVYYDAAADQLVVTMLYRGTNPNHDFSLNWGECKMLPDGSNEVVAEVIDSQARDAARQDFRKTVHLSLDGMSCRPAKLTLRAAPRNYFSMRIPAAPTAR
jgi:hypothetical protein